MGSCHSQGRIQDSLLRSTSSDRVPVSFWDVLSWFRKGQGFGSRGPASHGKRGDRNGTLNSGVLQSSFCGSQDNRRLPPYLGSLCPQQICPQNQVPDGNCEDSPFSSSGGRLDDFHRPQGCLLSGANTSRQPEVPPVHLERSVLSVSGPLLRPFHSPAGIHTDDGSSFSGFSSPRFSPPPLLGRLAPSCVFEAGGLTSDFLSHQPVLQTRNSDQLGKVFSHSNSVQDLFGDGDSLSSFEGFSHYCTPGKSSSPIRVLPRQQLSPGKGLVDSPGPYVFPDSSHSRGASKDEEPATSAFSVVGQTIKGGQHSYSLEQPHPAGPSVVVTEPESSCGTISTGGLSRLVPVHRCLNSRLGSVPVAGVDQWHVGTTRKIPTHQCFGAQSNPSELTSLFKDGTRPDSGCVFRQHYSFVLPGQGRGHSVNVTQCRGPKDFGVGRASLRQDSHTFHKGLLQCVGGLSQQAPSVHLHRMDTSSGRVSPALETVGLSNCRPVCHQAQFPASEFHLALSGSQSDSNRCLSVQLGPPGAVCLPSLSSRQEGAQQASASSEHQPHPHSSFLATKGMVSRSHPGDSGPTPTSSTSQGLTSPATRAQVSSRSPRASSSRMETIKRLLCHRGYSSRVAQFLAKSKRPSTTLNYQYKWKKYRLWCKREGHTVSTPSSQKFADFLVYLRQECKLSTSAIKGYKAMLNGVFSLKGFDLCQDQVLRDIIKACSSRIHRPLQSRTPSWNVDVVLRSLAQPPFEPLHLSSLRDLTKKTLFLVALATAKRVGELQALSNSVAKQGQDLLLSYLPEFIAKTETGSNPIPREFRLCSLSAITGRDDEERLLCPVRALKWYRHLTSSATRPRHLFLSVRDQTRPMSKAALSFFLRETIRTAHNSFPDSLCTPLKVRAHDLRGIATSMLLWKNSPIASILDAACWKTRSVFANHYLRDIQRQEGDVFALGPVVAAGEIVA